MLAAVCCLAIVLGCDQRKPVAIMDSPSQGEIKISVDEAFRPPIDQLLQLYGSTFPNARINVAYKPEIECFKDLDSDSVRMIVTGRGLTEKEIGYYRSKLSFKPIFDSVAFDAVAVVVNEGASDSVFTIKQLENILSGKNGKTCLMDGKSATGTVRFLKDKVLKGGSFGRNVVSAGSNAELLAYLSVHKDAIGFIGSGWLDKDVLPKGSGVKTALVQSNTDSLGQVFCKPTQSALSKGYYPYYRPLFYIVKENRTGLGTGFANFISSERGQLVFKRSGLVPAKFNLFNRRVLMN